MCFSATASFGASTLLTVMGVVSIAKARTIPQRFFAAIPLVFSVQQFSEGMLWLSLKDPDLAASQSFFIYSFLVFAVMVWPVWIPLSIRLLEKDASRKKMMNVILGIGAGVCVGVACILFVYPVHVVATHHHLHYVVDLPPVIKNIMWLFGLLYLIAIVITPFISGIKRMKWLGIVFAASYLVAGIFYSGFFVSVWCYFAAILSVVVIWILSGLRKSSLMVV